MLKLSIFLGSICGAMACAYASTALAADAPGYVTFVTAGLPDPNGKVPAFNAVPGAGVGSLAIADPLSVLQNGQVYTILVASQNAAFAGNCVSSYQLTQVQGGKTVKLASGTIHSFACGAYTSWGWAINTRPINGVAGPATLTGTVKYGSTSVTMKAPVLIQ